MTTTTKTIASLLLTFTLAVVAAAQSSIPDDLVRKNDLAAGDKATIKGFIDANKAGLGGSATDVKKSRETLTAPLLRGGVSVAFRVEYAGQLIPTLKTLAGDKDKDHVAANALRLAGELGTSNGMDVLIGASGDKRESVRYAATHGFARMFAAAGNQSRGQAAIQQTDADRALGVLAGMLQSDASPLVADGAGIAIIASIPMTKGIGVQRLADAGGARALWLSKSAAGADLSTTLRIAGAVRAQLADAGQALSPAAVKGAATFAGRSLVLVNESNKSGLSNPAAASQLTKACETLIALSQEALQKSPALPPSLSPKLVNAADFEKAVAGIVGQGGLLTQTPFGNKPDDFKP